ncbi:MAG: AtpZ/AtpI family protein [Terriglobales bacterium]
MKGGESSAQPQLPGPRRRTRRRRNQSVWYLLGEYSGLAVMMPAAAVIGYGIGAALDGWLHTGRLLTIVFVILGIAAGFVELIRVLSRTAPD